MARSVPKTEIGTPIRLRGLEPGQYAVSVIGRDVLGQWQTEATVSDTWTVDVNASNVRINEVLVHNVAVFEQNGEFPDAIELYNDSLFSRDLSGYSLSDRMDEPRKFVFPDGSQIRPAEFLVLLAERFWRRRLDPLGIQSRSHGRGACSCLIVISVLLTRLNLECRFRISRLALLTVKGLLA